MQAVSKIFPDKFINADDEVNSVREGEVLNAVNMRFASTDEGATGRWENVLSNALIPNTYLPVGTNTNICIHSSDATNYIILFNYNSNGNHGIYAYRKTDNTCYKVLLNSQVTGGLNFQKNKLITARIIGNLLFFTDNVTDPRRLNIESGIKLNHPSFATTEQAYTNPLKPEVITIARRPPNYPLAITKANGLSVGVTVNNNQISTFSGKFCWFYEYKDGETSTISPYSELANYNTKDETYDVITVTASFSEKIDQDVKRVIFGVIYSEDKTAFEIKVWDKDNTNDLAEINSHNSGVTPLTFQFTNSETGIAITSLNKPFDSVPLLSKTLERADNRIFLANNLMGYDTPKTTSLSGVAVTTTSTTTILKTGSSRRIGIVFFDKYMRQCGVVPYSKLITIADRGHTLSAPYAYAIEWILNNTNALNEIPSWAYYYSIVCTNDITRTQFIQSYAGDIFYAYRSVEGEYSFDKTSYSTDNAGIALRINSLIGYGMGYTFTEGDLVNVIVKTGATTTSKTLSVKGVFGDYIVADNYNFGTLDYNSIAFFEVYTPNNKTASNFFYEQGNIYPVSNPVSSSRQYSTTSGLIKGDVYLIDRESLNKITYNLPSGFITSQTLFTLKCQFVSQLNTSSAYSTGSSPLQSTSGFNPLTDNSRWILKTFANPVTFNFKGTLKYDSTNNNHFNAYIEYNNGSTKTAFYIVPDHKTDSGVIYSKDFNVDITVPANCRVYLFGNSGGHSQQFYPSSMVISTLTSSSQTKFEAMSPNDKFFSKWFTQAGRFQEVDKIGQQRLKTAVRWSGTYLSNRSNNLSSFDALNQKVLQQELEEINKLQLANKVDELGQGNVMLAICPSEVASMYLGEVQLMGAAAAGDVATIDGVIGSVNVLKGSYGTIHPESVVEHKGNVWWFDALSGRFAQYSVNGVDDIASGENNGFKFSRVAKRLADKILSMSESEIEALGSRPFVFAGVDPHHKEVYWTIPKLGSNPKGQLSDYSELPGYVDSADYPYDILDLQNKTLVFKMRTRWMGSFSWKPEGFTVLDSTVYLVKDGNLYKANVAGSYNNFFGVQYRSKIALVCNKDNTVKEFQTIAIEGTKPEWVHFRSEEPNVQSSDLVESDFENREGVYYAPILKDRLTPNADSYEQAQISGDEMRTKALRVLIQWDSDELIYLRLVSIGYNQSTGHY